MFRFRPGSFAPDAAAALSSFWNEGHSACRGAGQAAAWRKPRLVAFSLATVRSISSALLDSNCRSMSASPFGKNIEPISASVNPAD